MAACEPPVFQPGQLLAAGMIGEIARHDFRIRVVTGKGRAEDHAGIVPHSVGQSPALGQLRAFAGGLVAHDQRDAGITQSVDSGGDGQAGHPIEGRQVFGGNAELAFQVESAPAPGQLDDIRYVVDGLECRLTVLRS